MRAPIPATVFRVLIDSRTRSAEGEITESDPADARVPLLSGVRTRVLVSFLALLVLSTAASVLVLREVLLSRIGDQVEPELVRDVDRLQEITERGQGANGEPFT